MKKKCKTQTSTFHFICSTVPPLLETLCPRVVWGCSRAATKQILLEISRGWNRILVMWHQFLTLAHWPIVAVQLAGCGGARSQEIWSTEQETWTCWIGVGPVKVVGVRLSFWTVRVPPSQDVRCHRNPSAERLLRPFDFTGLCEVACVHG